MKRWWWRLGYTLRNVFARCECGHWIWPWQQTAYDPEIGAVIHASCGAEPFAITSRHLERQRAFSQVTFGPGARLAGVLDHIRKELVEVEAEPQDVSEWADLVILAFDGALRQGHEPQDILDAIEAKQERNERREWPDWRTQPADKAIEHVRNGGAS